MQLNEDQNEIEMHQIGDQHDEMDEQNQEHYMKMNLLIDIIFYILHHFEIKKGQHVHDHFYRIIRF